MNFNNIFSRWKIVLVIVLAVYSLTVLYYIFSGTFSSSGATDFHTLWGAGVDIIHGHDPIQTYFETAPNQDPKRAIAPSNTAPMLVVLSVLSFLPWETAKVVWMISNFVFMFLVFWMTVDRLPFPGVTLDHLSRLLLFFLFFDMSATRIAIENGQSTLFVFSLMLGAILLSRRSWLAAGFLLGLALSKYSVGLPVALFLLYRRKYRLLIAAALMQFLGVAVLSLISGNSILFIIGEYIKLLLYLANQPGVHLEYLFHYSITGYIISAFMTVIVFGLLWSWLSRYRPASSGILDFHLLSVLFIWTLLVAYHNSYDVLLLLVFIVLIFKSLRRADLWMLPERAKLFLVGALSLGLVVLIVPARLVDRFIPHTYDLLTNRVPDVFLIVFLSWSLFLLHRFLYQQQTAV